MIKKPIVTIVSILLLTGMPAHAQRFVESFDVDNSDWIHSRTRVTGRFVLADAGYNADGYLSEEIVPDRERRLYSLEVSDTAQYVDLLGQTLTVDQRVSGQVLGSDSDARAHFFVGRDGNHFISKYEWKPNENTGWQTHRSTVIRDQWTTWPGSVPTHFEAAVQAPEEIGVVFVFGPSLRNNDGWVGGRHAGS